VPKLWLVTSGWWIVKTLIISSDYGYASHQALVTGHYSGRVIIYLVGVKKPAY
jgi:hypothetical protein